MKSLHILGVCGSLRRQSTNLGLLRYAKEHAPSGVVIELADLQDVPFYNADFKEIPGPVQKFNESIGNADALLLACPEYNSTYR